MPLKTRPTLSDAIALALTAMVITIVGTAGLFLRKGEILATAEAHQATRIDGELSLTALREYREKFPPGRMPTLSHSVNFRIFWPDVPSGQKSHLYYSLYFNEIRYLFSG